MRKNKMYKSLLEKSIGSMLSAIEIYNKPNFIYREEIFAILAVNSWELLLKAYVLKLNKYNRRSIYVLKTAKKKDGSNCIKKKEIEYNRCNNPKTRSITKILNELIYKGKINNNLKENIDALIELRDNSIHFFNISPITQHVQKLGFACIKNYISCIKNWKLDIDLSCYNFYLMPLAYIDEKILVDTVMTSETENFINLMKQKLSSQDKDDLEYDIALSISIDFKKEKSLDAIKFNYGSNGIPIKLTEDDIRKKYPMEYSDVVKKCRLKYTDFKLNKIFHSIMKDIKKEGDICRIRRLEPENTNSSSKAYYNNKIFTILDKQYTKNR